MSRPGFVLEVDEKTPRLLTMAGSDMRLQRFGVGTRVVYAPDPVPSQDPVALIDGALEQPVGAAPLSSQLQPGTKLTVVVLDHKRPEPRMRFDVRRSILERVLEAAARAAVDDVEVVIATGLNRRWNNADITAVLGDRVATSFIPENLISSHDVTSEDLVTLGEVDGHPVRINQRVADSDVVVSIGVVKDDDDVCPFTHGLADVATINRLAGLHRNAEFNERVCALVSKRVPHFQVTAVLGQPLLGPSLSFLNKREWEWKLNDQLAFAWARQFVAAFPKQGPQKLYAAPFADYSISDLVGGAPEQVRQAAREAWRAAAGVTLPGQADILSVSVWGASFDHGNPVGSPINAAADAIVDQAGSHAGTPMLRQDGVLVAHHPLRRNFSSRTQSAASDFFASVLPETLDPAEIHERFEEAACHDAWNVRLYRDHFANHPLQVFHSWYRIQDAMSAVGEVIWVGADRQTAAVLGHRAASTFADALEIAKDRVGAQPSITHLHGPGRAFGVIR